MLNGEGLRVTLFVSGCSHKCFNCQNPQTHSPLSGIEFDINALNEIFEQLEKDYISGITFSGGDPMFQPKQCAVLAKKVHELGMNVWAYTGFTFEELLKQSDFLSLHAPLTEQTKNNLILTSSKKQ